jgi:hypothetical protein
MPTLNISIDVYDELVDTGRKDIYGYPLDEEETGFKVIEIEADCICCGLDDGPFVKKVTARAGQDTAVALGALAAEAYNHWAEEKEPSTLEATDVDFPVSDMDPGPFHISPLKW